MTDRLTKYEKSPNSNFPYKLKDDSLCTELDSIHKLGLIEDVMEKYGINSIELLDTLLGNYLGARRNGKNLEVMYALLHRSNIYPVLYACRIDGKMEQRYVLEAKEYNRLNELDILQEKLGCPLEVVFKALFNGIYESYIDYGDNNTVKTRHREVRGIGEYGLIVINLLCHYAECDETFEYKDYKKTWWLKEDRSE